MRSGDSAYLWGWPLAACTTGSRSWTGSAGAHRVFRRPVTGTLGLHDVRPRPISDWSCPKGRFRRVSGSSRHERTVCDNAKFRSSDDRHLTNASGDRFRARSLFVLDLRPTPGAARQDVHPKPGVWPAPAPEGSRQLYGASHVIPALEHAELKSSSRVCFTDDSDEAAARDPDRGDRTSVISPRSAVTGVRHRLPARPPFRGRHEPRVRRPQ